MKRLKLLVLSLSGVFLSLSVLLNAYAAETKAEAEKQAIEAKEEKSLPKAEDYRQALREVVVVKEEYFPQELDSYVRYMPYRGTKAQPGRVSIVDSAAEYSYEIKAFGKLPVQFGLVTDYVGINNTTSVKLPAHLTSVAFGVETIVPFFNIDKTYFTIGLAPTFATDDWGFHSSSFRIPQRYFLIYQPDDKWTFVCGVGVFPDYAKKAMPILGFIYKPNDRLTFNIIPKRPEISYALNRKLTVFAEGSMTLDEYEVTKDNFKNVILEYNEMHLGAGLKFNLNKHIKGSFSFGGMFNRSLKYRPDSLGKVTIKDGLYTEFRTDIVF